MSDFASDLLAGAVAAGAATSPGKTNDVSRCCDPPPEIVIALFFDGTGNNQVVDQELRKQDEKWAQQVKDAAHDDVQKSRETEQKAARVEKQSRQRLEKAQQERADLQVRVREFYLDAKNASERVRRARDKKIGGTPVEYKNAVKQLTALEAADDSARANYNAALVTLKAEDAKIKELTAKYEAAKRERERLSRERQVQEQSKANASPVTNGPSNIVKLRNLYPIDVNNHIYRFYIEGVGTFNDAKNPKDYSSLGQGFGLGEHGGRAKIEKAKEYVLGVLRGIQGCKPQSITFDVFGFSRGAALARHFVNVILAGVPDFTQQKEEHHTGVYAPFGNMLREMTEEMVPDVNNRNNPRARTKAYVYKPLGNDIVKIRFVGLFDTVGSFYWGGNDDEGEFVLNLPGGCAKKVVHLVSRDERRKNFRGTSIFDIKRAREGTFEEGEKKEITLGGVHSDIGGGYPLLTRSYHLMDYSSSFIDLGFGASGLKEKEALLAKAKEAEGIVAADGTLTEKYCFIKEFSRQTKDFVHYRWLLMRLKYTVDDYANYCLDKMWSEAPSDLKLRKIPKEYHVSERLKGLLASANPNAEGDLWEQYYHVSAIDNQPFEKYSPEPLGYYFDDFFLKLGMKLDENPLGPRVMFLNAKK